MEIFANNFNNEILIEVNITDKCNLNCYYCTNLINNYKRKNIDLDLNQLFITIMYIYNLVHKPIKLLLLGGEPTLNEQLLEFCKKISLYDFISIEIFTNLLKSTKFYLKYITFKNIEFRISYHNFLNNNFIEKLLFLYKNNFKISCLYIMLNPETFNNSIEVYNKFKNIINCELVKIIDVNNIKINYSKQQENFIINNNMQNLLNINIKNKNKIDIKNFFDISEHYNFYHWLCYAGKYQLYIDLNGDIYPCKNIKNKLATIYNYLNIQLKSTLCTNKKQCLNEITYRRKLIL